MSFLPICSSNIYTEVTELVSLLFSQGTYFVIIIPVLLPIPWTSVPNNFLEVPISLLTLAKKNSGKLFVVGFIFHELGDISRKMKFEAFKALHTCEMQDINNICVVSYTPLSKKKVEGHVPLVTTLTSYSPAHSSYPLLPFLLFFHPLPNFPPLSPPPQVTPLSSPLLPSLLSRELQFD